MDFSDNILTKKWQARYDKLSDDIKQKLEQEEMEFRQLKTIKRKRIYPEVGDVFEVISSDNIKLNGVVINNHINNINGDDLLVVALFKYGYDSEMAMNEGISLQNLLLPPQIVGKEYWTRGYFYNVRHYDKKIRIDEYGFYSVGKRKFFDEYGNTLNNEPPILGIFGVATINGISMKVNIELIIEQII